MKNINILYQQKEFPVLQNRVFSTQEEAIKSPKGDIMLVEDQDTGLVYNASFDASRIVYDQNYDNEQSHSEKFRAHLEEVAGIILDTMGSENLVEVGCGKGFFLELLLSKGADIFGFDPTYTGTSERVQKKFFEPGIIDSANGLILRHVLEHIENPVDFLFQLKEANGGKGLIYIEVPCFDWICENRAWFDIFYEHVNYFRLPDFHKMFGKVISSGRLFGGQYLFVVADLATIRIPQYDQRNSIDFPDDFLDNLLSSEHKDVAAIWGGGSKGVIFSLLRERHGRPVRTVIDINPSKQGKYLPLTGIKISTPVEAKQDLVKGTKVMVMNPNYADEIASITGQFFDLIKI